jgi:hypothetical protein
MSELNLPQAAEAQAPDVNVAPERRDDDDVSTMFAVVNADGTLARGARAVSAARLATGAYEVTFRKDVRKCAYVATIGLSGSAGSSLPGEITVVGRAGNDRAVFVTTHSSGGASADLGFHLAVLCADDDD